MPAGQDYDDFGDVFTVAVTVDGQTPQICTLTTGNDVLQQCTLLPMDAMNVRNNSRFLETIVCQDRLGTNRKES